MRGCTRRLAWDFSDMKKSFLLTLFAAGLLTAGAAETNFFWKTNATSVALWSGEKVVWQFNFDPATANKPHFHPLALPGGEPLTAFSPPDHPWHYGLWFSWKFINGVNYWEYDAKTKLTAGTTSWQVEKIETHADFSARIELALNYHPRESNQPLLTEHRVIAISTPAADGSYFMDWQLAFQAGDENLKFDRTPLPGEPGGKIFGGYAGLALRFAKGFSDCRVAGTEDIGEFTNERYHFTSKGADYNGKFGEREVGVAMLDHPANPRYPGRWYAAVSPKKPFCFFNAAWLQLKPYELPAHEKLMLQYRVVIHPGRWDSAKLVAEETKFAANAR